MEWLHIIRRSKDDNNRTVQILTDKEPKGDLPTLSDLLISLPVNSQDNDLVCFIFSLQSFLLFIR